MSAVKDRRGEALTKARTTGARIRHDGAMSVIRRYQPTDRGNAYRVCVMTDTSSGDATRLHTNDTVITDIFAGPDRAIEPELAFIVDTGDWMTGYVIATGNTRLSPWHYR